MAYIEATFPLRSASLCHRHTTCLVMSATHLPHLLPPIPYRSRSQCIVAVDTHSCFDTACSGCLAATLLAAHPTLGRILAQGCKPDHQSKVRHQNVLSGGIIYQSLHVGSVFSLQEESYLSLSTRMPGIAAHNMCTMIQSRPA